MPLGVTRVCRITPGTLPSLLVRINPVFRVPLLLWGLVWGSTGAVQGTPAPPHVPKSRDVGAGLPDVKRELGPTPRAGTKPQQHCLAGPHPPVLLGTIAHPHKVRPQVQGPVVSAG